MVDNKTIHVLYCVYTHGREYEMKAFWVDRETNKAQIVETNGGLEDMYRMCHCRCIDITVVSIKHMPFNVVVDDEGLLVDKPMITVFDQFGEPMLAGSVVFFGVDKETYELTSLDKRHLDALLERTGMAVMSDFTSRCVTIVDPIDCP